MAVNNQPEPYLPRISNSRLALITLVILGIVGMFYLLMQHPEILLILFAGIFLGIAIKPAVDWLGRRGLPQEVGAILIFLLILTLLAVFIGFGLPLLTTQTVNLTHALSTGYLQFRQTLLQIPNLLVRQIVLMMPEDIRLLQPGIPPATGSGAESSLQSVGTILGQVFSGAVGLILVFFLAVNWSVEGERILHSPLLPGERREAIREVFIHIEHRVSRYLRGLGLLSLIVGSMALAGYLVIGLPYALVLAVFAGIMEAVPVIGPAIGAVPAVIVALSISPGAALAVIGVSVLIQASENMWIFPRVMGSSLGVPPFVTLITMLAFSTLFGIAGAFIAIPVAAVFQVLLEALVEHRRKQVGDEFGRDQVGAVRYEIRELRDDIRAQLRTKKLPARAELDDLVDSLEAIALDLDTLLQLEYPEEPS
jgi:predicted PurR-regulated permease PerM